MLPLLFVVPWAVSARQVGTVEDDLVTLAGADGVEGRSTTDLRGSVHDRAIAT